MLQVAKSKLVWFAIASFLVRMDDGLAKELNSITLDSETTAGQGTFSQALKADGDVDVDQENSKWTWNLGYTFSSVPSATNNASSTANTKSSEFSGGGGYVRDWNVGLDLFFNTTPSEALKSFGPSLHLGYRYKFLADAPVRSDADSPTPKSASHFTPSVGLTLTIATVSYSQDFSGSIPATKRRPTRATTTSETIRQNSGKISLRGSPLDWLSLDLFYTKYHYNKNVATFMSLLNTPQAVRTGAIGFSDTIEGFPDYTKGVEATWYAFDTWELELEALITRIKLDQSVSHGWNATLSDEISDHWKPGIGVVRSVAPSTRETLGLLKLEYTI